MIADVLGSVHTFRKAEQSLDLLDYERSYFKNCVNGAFMPPEAMPLTWILRYETHIVVVLCSPERMHCFIGVYIEICRIVREAYYRVKPLLRALYLSHSEAPQKWNLPI